MPIYFRNLEILRPGLAREVAEIPWFWSLENYESELVCSSLPVLAQTGKGKVLKHKDEAFFCNHLSSLLLMTLPINQC